LSKSHSLAASAPVGSIDLRQNDPAAFLRHEIRARYGRVPETISGLSVERGHCRLVGDEFLAWDHPIRFHYRRGEGVTVELLERSRPGDEYLYLNGSVYAAVACINGFYPMHASAVAHDGAVHAFTGPSGAGKSTLVAALGARGLPMFCDDTLVLDLSDPQRPMALPGHKRLKLGPEALVLTGATAREPVGSGIDKHYADPPGGDWTSPLPLARLVFLEAGDPDEFVPITGAERMARLSDDHYTADFFRTATQLDNAGLFHLQARLAGQIAMWRLVRRMDGRRFANLVKLAHDFVTAPQVQP
jgi:hypothetical protein